MPSVVIIHVSPSAVGKYLDEMIDSHYIIVATPVKFFFCAYSRDCCVFEDLGSREDSISVDRALLFPTFLCIASRQSTCIRPFEGERAAKMPVYNLFVIMRPTTANPEIGAFMKKIGQAIFKNDGVLMDITHHGLTKARLLMKALHSSFVRFPVWCPDISI